LRLHDLKSLTGRGVTATLDGETVWIGKAEMFGVDGLAPLGDEASQAIVTRLRLERDARPWSCARATRDLGAIGLLDTPRPAARAALDALRRLGIARMIMISGDHQHRSSRPSPKRSG
jgi:Cd2+/Zn2+-exporting ATPase